ncbi:MAG: hypothetical protein ACRCU5_12785 [Rhizobiaceae bacterium]
MENSAAVVSFLVPVLIVGIPLLLKFGVGIGAKNIPMRNDRTGQITNGKYGFSWTYLFFGFFVPLFRGELGVSALHLLFGFVTLGIWNLVVSFLYNKQYTNRLLEKGFKFVQGDPRESEAASKLGVDLALMHKA